MMVPPGRITVVRAEPSEAARDYRSAPPSTKPGLLVRFSAFHWFNLLMIVLCVAPLTPFARAALGSVGAVIGAGVTAYALAAVLFNRVEVRVDEERVTSRLAPIPIWPSKSIPRGDVTNIVATRTIQTPHSSEATNVAWYVVAIAGERQFPITRHLRKRDEAVFVARMLEDHLGLASSAALDDDGSGSTMSDD